MYYHINDIIFLVRFPQFVGSLRRDVWTTAYWRDRSTPLYTSPLSARTLMLSYRLSSIVLRHLVPRSVVSFWPRWKRAINEPILRAVARKRVVRGAPICGRCSSLVKEESRPARADEIEISFRLDGDTQLCINPGYGVRMHRKLARPSGPARVHFNY